MEAASVDGAIRLQRMDRRHAGRMREAVGTGRDEVAP
jgi:hypothetical protein